VFSFLRRTADDVALPALSCGAAAAQLSAGTPAVQQSINISRPLGPQQQTRNSDVWRPDGAD